MAPTLAKLNSMMTELRELVTSVFSKEAPEIPFFTLVEDTDENSEDERPSGSRGDGSGYYHFYLGRSAVLIAKMEYARERMNDWRRVTKLFSKTRRRFLRIKQDLPGQNVARIEMGLEEARICAEHIASEIAELAAEIRGMEPEFFDGDEGFQNAVSRG